MSFPTYYCNVGMVTTFVHIFLWNILINFNNIWLLAMLAVKQSHPDGTFKKKNVYRYHTHLSSYFFYLPLGENMWGLFQCPLHL